jgi:hypothetical protein
VAIDERRRDRRLNYAIPERVARDDVEAEVAARRQLENVLACVTQLAPAERSALTADYVSPESRTESVRLAVRRHRVRSRLLAMVEALGAMILGAGRMIRRRPRTAVAAAVLPALVLTSFAWHLRPLPPARDDIQHTSTSIRSSVPTSPSRTGTSLSPPRAPTLADDPSSSGQYSVNVPLPGVGGEGSVEVRPRTDDDHFLCVDEPIVGSRCVDLPIRIVP